MAIQIKSSGGQIDAAVGTMGLRSEAVAGFRKLLEQGTAVLAGNPEAGFRLCNAGQ